MFLSGYLLENFIGPYLCGENTLFDDGYSAFRLIDQKLDRTFIRNQTSVLAINYEGIWNYDKKKGQSILLKSFSKEPKVKELEFRFDKLVNIKDDFFLAITSGEDIDELIVFYSSSDEKVTIEVNEFNSFSFDSEYIFLRTESNKKITCLDYELNILWEKNILSGRIYLDFERKPQTYNNLLIINHSTDTIALNKTTGEEVWKYSFDSVPTSNVLMEGKIYAVCQAVFYVINPDTGKLEWSKETGYEPYFPDTGNLSRDISPISVLPVGDYFYGVAGWADQGEIIRLYDKELNLLYKASFQNYYINLNLSIRPTILDGKIYQEVRNAYSYSDSGVVVIELTEDESQAGIHILPRPEVTMMASPSLQEKHKLQIFLKTTTLDDSLRYGELFTQELHFATGYITMYKERESALDIKHNGLIELILDDTGFEPDSDIYLNQLTEKLTESLSSHIKKAGDKQTPISFSLVRQPKDQWDMSGDVLDWPAIRDQKTPISE